MDNRSDRNVGCKVCEKLRVVFVHQDGKLTGSAFSLLNLVRGFNNALDLHVVMAEKGPFEAVLREEKISYTIHPFVRFWTFPGPQWYHKSAFRQLKALVPDKKLAKHIIDLNPDIVHLNDKACLQAGISLKKSGVPIVQHLRSSYYPANSKILSMLSNFFIKSYSQKLIAISEDEADEFERNPDLNIIYNTVDQKAANEAVLNKAKIRRELGFKDAEIIIGFAANISEKKGAWDFLNMSIELTNRFPKNNLRFVMAGNLPDSSANGSRLVSWGLKSTENPVKILDYYKSHPQLKDRLMILGFRKDILQLIAAFDILVVCTRLGVVGRQPFEAMAVGTPVVVSNGHSGKSTIVEQGKTGLVVPMKDSKALSAACSKLIENPALRIEIGRNGIKSARRNFNPAINAEKVLNIYRKLFP